MKNQNELGKFKVLGQGVVFLIISLLFLGITSPVYPITEAVAEEFQKHMKGAVKVTVGISGTGGGFKKFSRGETDISDASRPIVKKEMDACKEAGIEYIELSVAYDGIAVMVNRKNSWVSSMTPEDLKKVWEPAAERKVT